MTWHTGCALWTNIVNKDDLVHWFVLYDIVWWLGTLVSTLWTNIVNEDDLAHWFVLYERILLMRMTWYTGFCFMNEYC